MRRICMLVVVLTLLLSIGLAGMVCCPSVEPGESYLGLRCEMDITGTEVLAGPVGGGSDEDSAGRG